MKLKDYWIMGLMAFVAFAVTVVFAVAIGFALASGLVWGLGRLGIAPWRLVQPIVWGVGVLLFAPLFTGQAMPALFEAYQRMQRSAAARRRR